MNGLTLVAGITLREAVRRRILWTALACAAILLTIFGIALRLQVLQFQGRPMSPFVRYQVESGMLMIGLYTCDLLAVVMTILASIDTIAGEISSGTIHAIAAKPLARWQIVLGKFIGFAAMIVAYVAITFAGTVIVARAITGVVPEHPLRGVVLIVFECLDRAEPDAPLRHLVLDAHQRRDRARPPGRGVHGRLARAGERLLAERADRDARRLVESRHARRVALAPRGVRDADAARWIAVVLAVRERVDPEQRGAGVRGGVLRRRDVCRGGAFRAARSVVSSSREHRRILIISSLTH